MGVYMINQVFLEDLCDEIVSINKILINQMIENAGDILISSEYIKFVFSNHLLEDINFLITLSGTDIFKPRHADMILRDMIEQTIEFIYLIKHPEMIAEFMGDKIENCKISDGNPVKSIHLLGGKRYSGGRKSVSEMENDIGEKNHWKLK